jgi:hypothetical protein
LKLKSIFVSLTVICSLILSIQNISPAQAKPSKKTTSTSSTTVSDADFINVNGLSVSQIQNILSANGSFLRNFSEGGRTAAQIIWDAAHGYGEASGTINGIKVTNTVNPAAILATLQKEQSLIYMKDRNDDSLRAAMGYGCPDSGGCNGKYAGFTAQVENGAWQLRYNYERAKGHGFSDYQVGQTITVDGQRIYLSSRVLASLYRYTPHLGTNFYVYFNKWFGGTTTATATAATSSATDTSQCELLSSKSARRLCKINLAKGITTATTTTTSSAAASTTNCDLLSSKSQRRLCRIQQATGQAAPTASVTNTSTTSNVTAATNCETFGSKSAQRLCRIEQAKILAQTAN